MAHDKNKHSDGERADDCYWVVNKHFLPYKAHYFLLNGAHVGVIPYLPVYAKSALGCSATTVGLLATCMQFSATISKPVFGLLADCINHMKILIAALLCLEVILNLLMLALPPVNVGIESILYQDQPASGSREANSILRFAPARVYDASVGLHSQPRDDVSLKRDERNSPGRSRNGTEVANRSSFFAVNSRIHKRARQTQLQMKITNSSTESFQRLNRRTYKCDLICHDLISEAVCYQNAKFCIDSQVTNLLSCSLKERTSIPKCENFHMGSNFTVSYHITNFFTHSSEKSAKSLKVLPANFVYHRRSHNRWKRFTCNVTSTTCKLSCEKGTKFCMQKISESNLYQTYQFWTFCLFALVGSMCQAAIYTLSDTACYEKIRGTKSDFGKQRLWGAIGWGVVAPLTGFLNDLATGHSIHEDYSSGWYIMAILSFFFLINLYCMEFPQSNRSSSMCKDVRQILSSRQFILMEMNVFFLGVLNAYASNYVIWYMESLGSTRMQMGLALAVECLFGEAPFMYVSGWLISRLGHWHIVTITFAAFSVRFGTYYLITDPWTLLPVELLHGITFGLFYTTMTSYGEFLSSSGTEATIQGLLGGTYQGLGSGVGCLVAGISFDRFGGRRSFLLVSIFSLCLVFCHSALCLICKPQKTDAEKLSNNCKS